MDVVSGVVAGAAAVKEAKDRKKVMKEEKEYRDKTLEMEEEKHKIFMSQELEKSEKEKEKQRITLETEELRKEKEKVELEIKKLEHEKLKSVDSNVSSRQKRESVLNLQKEMERLEIEMKKLDLQKKEQQMKKITEESADKDSQFIEAATEGNIKLLTTLSKNIEELDLDYIKAAHDIAVNQGNPTVSRLTQLALDKKNKIENSKIKEPKSKVEPGKIYQKFGSVGPEEKRDVLLPEAQFGHSRHGGNGGFSETVVKTMPDGSVMRTTRTTKGLNSRADKSQISTNNNFPSMGGRMFSSGFESSFGSNGFESSFGSNFGDFGNLESRLGQRRLSKDSMFSGREGFPKMRSMMNDDSFNSSRFDMNFKSINK